jgi:hypothetical protein
MSRRADVLCLMEQVPAAPFCDSCVALEIKVSLQEARAMLAELERDHRIDRLEGRCSRCARSVSITRLAESR